VGSDISVDLGGGDSLILIGVRVANISAVNFVL
jgi:hypothetical protein